MILPIVNESESQNISSLGIFGALVAVMIVSFVVRSLVNKKSENLQKE